MEKLEVTGCGDCPFAAFAGESIRWQCFHPGKVDFIANIDEELITPSWCPLKQSPITISIKQDEQR